eukprot:TRINITY_DN11216_c0_g1_i1.p1 TRINITY_DN11216_c0_g1~~TRINITY_DN11216_c0_g1_i1.p1  ORF type:complete len:279 (-),score=8.02 TRINITY_DN11216_c0_g1_i1:50-886(-)
MVDKIIDPQFEKETISFGTFKDHWVPKDYLNEFYNSPIVVPDELEAIRFQIEYNKILCDNPLVLEFGCGPTVHRTIAIAPYVSEIHMVDYLQSNLDEVKKWFKEDVESHNWDHYIKYILECEGIKNPTNDDIFDRKKLTRSKVTRFIRADAGERYPLGTNYEGHYSHVFSGFCADSATDDKNIWKKYMLNIASLVSPNGTFFITALKKAKYYKSGQLFFKSANIDEIDLRKILEVDFLPQDITIHSINLPELEREGYTGIYIAQAQKKKNKLLKDIKT